MANAIVKRDEPLPFMTGLLLRKVRGTHRKHRQSTASGVRRKAVYI
jgi:hypothetical protein